MFRERDRLGAHHVATGVLNFCEASENDIQQEQFENIENSLEICIYFGEAWDWVTIMDRYDYIKLMQIKKVSRTSGRSNIFEGHITGKSKIVKIHWKYVSFLTPQIGICAKP